jgi:hypothetical protein
MEVIMKHAMATCVLGAVGLCIASGCTRARAPAEGTETLPSTPSSPALAVPAIPSDTPSSPDDASVAASEPSKLIAFYFHRTVRCHSCLAIEDLARRAIEAGFIEALGEGRLEWRPLNLDEAENAHFEKDFELTTQSLVLATVRKGETIAWKNLTDVWKLLDNPAEFERYVRDEVAKRLAGP